MLSKLSLDPSLTLAISENNVLYPSQANYVKALYWFMLMFYDFVTI